MAKRFKKHNRYHSRTYYYISLYEEYPIYEPAEGGYYYAGRELVRVLYKTPSYKKARRFYDKNFKKYHYSSKYIGGSSYIKLERKLGEYVSGKQIYC